LKIALLVARSDRSYLVRHIVDLAIDLIHRGHEVRVVSVLKPHNGGFIEELGDLHICLKSHSMSAGVTAFGNLMKSGAPDAIISAGSRANCVAGLARKMAGSFTRLMFMEQEVPGYEDFGNPVIARFWSWMQARTYPHADRIVVPTYEVKRRLLSKVEVDEGAVREFCNPGQGYFSPPIKAPHPWLTEARSEPTFVSAGTLDKNSDFATLIAGIEVAQKDMPCKVIILGDGPEKKRLIDGVKAKKLTAQVAFARDIENLHDYVYFSDGLISTARSSACPDAVIRAMELSSRIICTASPGGSRQVLGNGRYGKMLRMQDPEAVSYALFEAMQQPKSKPSDRDVTRFDRTEFFEKMHEELIDMMTLSGSAEEIGASAKMLAINSY
jgi:hypothetical protein